MRISTFLLFAIILTLAITTVCAAPKDKDDKDKEDKGKGKVAKPIPTKQQHPGEHDDNKYQNDEPDDNDFKPGKGQGKGNSGKGNTNTNSTKPADDKKGKNKNKFQVTDTTINVESTFKGNPGRNQDKFSLKFEADDEVEIALKNSNKTVDPSKLVLHGDFKFTLRFLSVIQYVETTKATKNDTITMTVNNGADVPIISDVTVTKLEGAPVQNGYQKNDTLCKEIPITGKGFKIIQLGTEVIANNTITSFKGTTADGIFSIIIHLTGGNGWEANTTSYYKDGRLVIPTSVKFDLVVNATNFPRNTSAACNNTQYAIRAIARSQYKFLEVIPSDGQPSSAAQYAAIHNKGHVPAHVTHIKGVQTGGDATPVGFFKWAPTAAVNGGPNVTNVIISSLQTIDNYYDDDDKKHGSNGEDGKSDYRVSPKKKKDEKDDLKYVSQAIYSFAAINPRDIVWDPEIGTDVDDSEINVVNGTMMTSSVSIITLMVTIFITLFQL